MKTKRLVINGIEDISIIEQQLDPNDMKDDECLIETYVSLISAGTELSRVYGLKKGAKYPVYPGYCSVGKVLKAGDKVSEVKTGDVVLFGGPHASLQFFCRERSDGGILFKLNNKTRPIDGTLLMMCSIAANGILPADIKMGDTAVIVGLGSLGLICSVLYQQMGVDVIALDPVKKRADIAKKMGIKNVVSCAPDKQVEQVMKLTNNKGANIVVEASGLSECVETAIKIAARYGQVILLGSPRVEYTTNVTDTFNAIHTKMLNVIGAFNRRYPFNEMPGSRISLKRNLEYLEKLLNNKIINSDLFISHVVSPTEESIMDGYRGLMHDKEKYTGVIIDWTSKRR